MSLLKYFETPDDTDAGWNSGAGITILKAIHILANGTEALVTSMTSCNLASILVRCLQLFISLPPPGVCVCVCVCVCGECGCEFIIILATIFQAPVYTGTTVNLTS